MKRPLAAIALAVAVSLVLPDPASAAEVNPGAADHIAARINQERAAHGLAPLALRGDLNEIAQGHSYAMASKATIWHNDSYFTQDSLRRLNARGLGENVALNGDAEDAHQRLMASPGHRANILNGAFDTVGIAVVQEGGSLYITQNFVDTYEGGGASMDRSESQEKVSKGKGKGSKGRKGRFNRTRRARR